MAQSNQEPKSNKATVIKTVIAILVIQAIAAGLFFAGIRYEQNQTAAKRLPSRTRLRGSSQSRV
jgi:hypothetical protein